MIPRAKSWAPLKMAMIEARKAKPGTLLPPLTTYVPRTTARTTNPNRVKTNPIRLAIWSGRVLKPVVMLSAWVTSIRNV